MFWLGLIGWLMAFCGVYLIGEKKVAGFYVNVFANALLIVDAILFAHWSLVFAMLAFTTLNIVNIWKWQFRKRGIDEATFFLEHPEFVMEVFRADGDVSVEISHDTHEKADVYLTGPANTETKLRQQAVQTVLDNLG